MYVCVCVSVSVRCVRDRGDCPGREGDAWREGITNKKGKRLSGDAVRAWTPACSVLAYLGIRRHLLLHVRPAQPGEGAEIPCSQERDPAGMGDLGEQDDSVCGQRRRRGSMSACALSRSRPRSRRATYINAWRSMQDRAQPRWWPVAGRRIVSRAVCTRTRGGARHTCCSGQLSRRCGRDGGGSRDGEGAVARVVARFLVRSCEPGPHPHVPVSAGGAPRAAFGWR